jgi:quercetin dioxygenase-like cupin family protein
VQYRTGKEEGMAEYKMENPDKPDKKRDELKGKVLALKDLVNYADGTVASRMIVSRKAGNITLFSFDENEGLSEHTAPFDAVVTILEGECEVWVAGQTYRMREGETIIFPANVPHALSAITKFKMTLTMIKE